MPRLLITANHLRERRGSELVTFELAEEFALRGWHVDIYTNLFLPPMADRFLELAKRHSVRVAEDPYEDFGLDYDLIWMQHSLLPPSIIRRLAERETQAPIIWHHMSPIVEIEQPLLVDIENEIADLRSFISLRTQEELSAFGLEGPSQIFANPAPRDFARLQSTRPLRLERLAIISNHPPAEVIEASELLRERGIEVQVFGEQTVSVEVTPELLVDFDGVLTIGKTVQYSLMVGVPVYVYDHFGGEGWLGPDGFELQATTNFSGRATGRRITGDEIAHEIVDGYPAAAEFARDSIERSRDRYSLEHCLDRVLSSPEVLAPRRKGITPGRSRQWLALGEQLRGMYRTIEHLQDRLAAVEGEAASAAATNVEASAEESALTADRSSTEPEPGSVHIVVLDSGSDSARIRTQASILQQTHAPITVTVVVTHDASGGAQFEGYAAAGVRSAVMLRGGEEPHLAALNRAVEDTASEFVVVHDGSTAWHPRFIETTVAHLHLRSEQVGAVVVPTFGSEHRVNDAIVETAVSRPRPVVGASTLDAFALAAAELTPHGGFVWRRRSGIEAGFFDPVLVHSAAWDFGLRMLHRGPIGVVNGEVPFVTIFESGAVEDERRQALSELASKGFRMDDSPQALYSSVAQAQSTFTAEDGKALFARVATIEGELNRIAVATGGFELRIRSYLRRLPNRVGGRLRRAGRWTR